MVVLDLAPVTWSHPRMLALTGDATDEAAVSAAADQASAAAPLAGWVNNAAVFRDLSLDTAPAAEVVALIALNLAPSVVGSAVAVRRVPGGWHGRRDRQRLVAPGPTRGPRRAALRDREGGGRGPDPVVGGRLRAVGHPR